MTLYYVYNVKAIDGSRVHAFVVDSLAFAKSSFNPAIMEFSGVSIEADSPEEAEQVYMCPQAQDKMCACEEPLPTQLKRMMGSNEEVETIQSLTKDIVVSLIDISFKLSTLARSLSVIEPDVQPEEFYAQLKQQYAKEFIRLFYRPNDG